MSDPAFAPGAGVTGVLRAAPAASVQPRRSVRAGAAWLTAGSALYAACQYGLLVAIAKLGTPAMVGQFVLAQAITSPVIILAQMQLRQVQVTDVHRTATFADYFWTRLLTTGLALLGIAVYAAGHADRGVMMPLILAVAAGKASESLSDIAYGRLQQHEAMGAVALAMAVKGVASLAVFTAALWRSGEVVVAAGALAVTWLLLLLLVDLPLQARVPEPLGSPRPSLRRTWPLLAAALPLALAAGLTSLAAGLPRYFLDGRHGAAAVAGFAVAATPLLLLGLLGAALGQAALPQAAAALQRQDLDRFRRIALSVTRVQVLAGAAATAVSAAFGAPLIRLFFTAEYTHVAGAMTLMSAGATMGALGSHGALALWAGRHFRVQFWHILAVVLLQLALCAVLVGPWGVTGAAWAESIRHAAAGLLAAVLGSVLLHRRQLTAHRA